MVLAFRDWVTWQAFFNSDSRNSSSARAEERQGEHGWGIPSLNKATPGSLPTPRPSTWPGRPRQDTDDDRHCRRHLPNLFVSLHDLLDPRLGRGQKTRTLSPPSQKGVLGGDNERGYPGRKGAGGTDAGRARKGAGRPCPRTPRCARPPPQPGLGPSLPRARPAPPRPGHVLTGGNRALYFFFLLGISGSLLPRRAQRRRPQLPGPRACSPPACRGSPGSWCRLLRPRRSPRGPSAAGQDAALRAGSALPLEPP